MLFFREFLVLLVFPVAVRPSLLSCPRVPAELGTAHLLPLPSALGMAEPKGSVPAAVPVAARCPQLFIPFIPFIYASLPERGRGVQGHIPSPTRFARQTQTPSRPARNPEMHKPAPHSRSKGCRSVWQQCPTSRAPFPCRRGLSRPCHRLPTGEVRTVPVSP